MALKERLQSDMVEAMRAGDVRRRDTLRLLLAAVKQEEVDEQTVLDDEGVQAVLLKQGKQRRESIADAEKAGRPELAEHEQAELQIIEGYLPRMMSADEIRAEAAAVISEVGATGPQDMGRVMGRLMPRLKGQADGRLVNEVVRDILQN
ncbi:MAG: GatB/YqeY domain-containing protein [Candidatus Promineifilaceae bacterium]